MDVDRLDRDLTGLMDCFNDLDLIIILFGSIYDI